MIPLYTQEEYESTKSTCKLPFKCELCDNTFYRFKKEITHSTKDPIRSKNSFKYCSRVCQINSLTLSSMVPCTVCKKEVLRRKSDIASSKTGNIFCSNSCSATYSNTHKTTGTRKSKLECWLEKQLNEIYPSDGIQYNDKTVIGSELDIYFPLHKVAFELNGVFHYQPIYGQKKLEQTIENDKKKVAACRERDISLHILDVSNQKIFTPANSMQYLNFIIQVINSKKNS